MIFWMNAKENFFLIVKCQLICLKGMIKLQNNEWMLKLVTNVCWEMGYLHNLILSPHKSLMKGKLPIFDG